MAHCHPHGERLAGPPIKWAALLVLAVILAGCSSDRGRTTQMNPDCTQVSAEEQARGNCMYRPEVPEGM